MALSVLDLFSVGIGPSSSHTVGPMRAAKLFADGLKSDGQLSATIRVQAELFGSLGATRRGHGSDKAVVLGLQGQDPETVDTATADDQVAAGRRLDAELRIGGDHRVDFNWDEDVVLHRRKSLPAHPNGMTFRALDHAGDVLSERSFYSIGGGFVVDGTAQGVDQVVTDDTVLPYPFTTANELLEICRREHMSISDVMLANELVWRTEADLREKFLALWAVMRQCVDNGCAAEGILPGGLNVPRRAPALFRTLSATAASAGDEARTPSLAQVPADPLLAMEWVNLFALAVNEENAAGGRIVTAPTNGAAGIVPAVLHYYVKFVSGSRRRRRGSLPPGGGRRRDPVQDQRLDFGGGGRLPGRSRIGLFHGGGGTVRGAGRDPGAGGKRRRSRDRTQPRPDLRPRRRAGADPLHRTQRDRQRQSHQRRPPVPPRRRQPQGLAG